MGTQSGVPCYRGIVSSKICTYPYPFYIKILKEILKNSANKSIGINLFVRSQKNIDFLKIGGLFLH